jgi:hypothetical protein
MRRYLMHAAVLSVVFAATTAVFAVVAQHDRSHTDRSQDAGSSSVTSGRANPGQRVQVSGGPGAEPTLCCPPPIPNPRPLRAKPINRAIAAYLDALSQHDLRALKHATCPRLRHTEVGVALHGKYVRAWRGQPYDIQPGLDFVTVQARVEFTDPASGHTAGQAVYSWNVQRSRRGHYSVCGFLS